MPGRADDGPRSLPRHDGARACRTIATARSMPTANWSQPSPRPGLATSRQRIERSAWCWSTTSRRTRAARRAVCSAFNRPKPEDVTTSPAIFALLLRAGACIIDGLELLATDRPRPAAPRRRRHPIARRRGRELCRGAGAARGLFPPMYIALVRVGEASPSLDQVLEVLAGERARSEALRRRLSDDPLSVVRARRGRLRAALLPHSCCRSSPACCRISAPRSIRSSDLPQHLDLLRGNPDGAGRLAATIAAIWLCSGRSASAAASPRDHGQAGDPQRDERTARRCSAASRPAARQRRSICSITLRILIDMMATTGLSAGGLD